MRECKIFSRIKIIQLFTTLIAVFLSVGIPIINYLIFKSSLEEGVEAGNLEEKYDTLIIAIIVVGLLISICSYMYFRYPKYSVRKGVITLSHSVLDLIFLIIFSQFAIINIFSKNDCGSCSDYGVSGISLDLSGLYIIIIIVSSLFVLKNAYDLFEFKINEKYYITRLREQRLILKRTKN